MDATASIVNIIQLTETLVDYLRAASQAPSDRRKLLLEANSLLALLISLRDFVAVEDEDDFLEWRRAVNQLQASDGPFTLYQKDLEKLLKKIYPQERLARVTQTILWKLTKADVNESLLRIERMKTLISIALEMDHTRLSKAVMTEILDLSAITQLVKSDVSTLMNSLEDAEFQALLDRICPENYASVYQSNITEHTMGIGQNFIASSDFEGWAASDGTNRLLMCLGDPGVGKTVMATKAIQALRDRNNGFRKAVLFVYCDCTRRRSRLARRDSSPEARIKGVQTPGHFLSSLLRQLVHARGSPSGSLQELMERHERQKTQPKPKELEQAFADIAAYFEQVYIVVDAIDECDSADVEAFSSHLLSMCASPYLRLLVTSRRQPQIEQLFGTALRLEMRAHEKDTLHYLHSRAGQEFPPRVLRDQEALDRIFNALLRSANGIPLIARLHMNALRGLRTPGAMLAAIDRLTSNADAYDETYRAAMERITKQPGELPLMAMRVFRWVVCAKRYLHARELQCVLAIDENSDSLDKDFVPDLDDVFLACEGLVCAVGIPGTEDVRVELVHTTTRQYFDKKLAEWAPDIALDLSRTCLNILSFEDLDPLPTSLVFYAWRYWGHHAKDVEELHEEEQFGALTTVIRKFLTHDGNGSPLSQIVVPRGHHNGLVWDLCGGCTGYHLVAKFDLTRVFQALRRPSDDLNTILGERKYDTTPLLQAVAAGSTDMVKLMLDLKVVDPNARNSAGVSPLRAAFTLRDFEVVKLLLSHGAETSVVTPADGPLE